MINDYPNLDPNALIYIPYPRVNCLKTIPFTAAHTYMVHIWLYRSPGVTSNNVASVCGGLTTNDFQLINYINLLSTCISSSLSGYFFFMCGGSTGEKSTSKKQRSNRERQPNSEQFLFHYATLKDILG